MVAQKFLKHLFLESLEQRSPSRSVSEYLSFNRSRGKLKVGNQQFEISEHPVYVFAVGKAAVPMFEAAYDILRKSISGSLVVTSDKEQADFCTANKTIVGSHPVPDEQSLKAGREAKQFFEQLPSGSVLITLLSGGTSSLLCLPADGISVGDLNHTFELLNNSGATISEINTVRKHCSQLKGGQMLAWLDPDVYLVDLVISDVPGNDLSIIGSGPTAPDNSTFQNARDILVGNDLWDNIPESVRSHIENGLSETVPETIKPGWDPLHEHQSYIISSADQLTNTIAELAQDEGYEAIVAEKAYNDDVAVVASEISDRLEETLQSSARPILLIFYGESTVTVTGEGKGGRNQELALRGALKIAEKNVSWLSAGTDGIDGPTDAAGAIVDGKTIDEAKKQGINPERYLENNDSYHFHEKMGTLLKTGPTGNNLMDVTLLLVSN